MARRLDHFALNRFQRRCISPTQEMITDADSQPDNTAPAELVAWLRQCEHRDLMLHWSLPPTRDL